LELEETRELDDAFSAFFAFFAFFHDVVILVQDTIFAYYICNHVLLKMESMISSLPETP